MSHRYWRVVWLAVSNPSQYAMAAEVKFLSGGVSQMGSGTALASSTYTGYTAGAAADNNNATDWSSNLTFPQSWGYDFGAGNAKSIDQVTIIASGSPSYDGYAPTSFTVDWSDDGSSFTQVQQFTCAAWTSGLARTFTLPAPAVTAQASALILA